MVDVIEKMNDQVPNRLIGLHVLLSAMMAIGIYQRCGTAVQAGFFVTFVGVRHQVNLNNIEGRINNHSKGQ